MKSVLIIEDDPTVREAYKIAMERQGYKVSVAADGMQGWKILREDLPDIVLLDILLPKLNGHEILQAWSKIDEAKRPKVIVVTNLSTPSDKSLASEFGANEYYVKSQMDIKDLVSLVAALTK